MVFRSVLVASKKNALGHLLVKKEFLATSSVLLNKEAGTAESMAHKVGDKVEKAGENLKETAKDSKEPAESGMREQVRSAAEKIGDATASAGDKIEHSMEGDGGGEEKSKLNKRNLEDKQVLSN